MQKNEEWRLPTRRELAGLLWSDVDDDSHGYCKDSADKSLYLAVFVNPMVACWAADHVEGAFAYAVDFRFGWVGTLPKGQLLSVRLVRNGGQKTGVGARYKKSEDGLSVLDCKTGLYWQSKPQVLKITHAEAVSSYRNFMVV